MRLPHATPASDDDHRIVQFPAPMAQPRYNHAAMRRRTALILLGLPLGGLILILELVTGATVLVLPTCLAIAAAFAA